MISVHGIRKIMFWGAAALGAWVLTGARLAISDEARLCPRRFSSAAAGTIRLSPMERAAIDTAEYMRTHQGAIPHPDIDSALYTRYQRYKGRKEFRSKLEELSPELFKKFLLAEKTTLEITAEETVEYIVTHGGVPQQRVNASLYRNYFRFKRDPEFQAIIRARSPQAWGVILKSEELVTPEFIDEVVAYVAKYGSVPMPGTHQSLVRMFLRHKDTLEFQRKLRRFPKAWEVFVRSEEQFTDDQVRAIAAEIVRRNGFLTIRDDRDLYNIFYRFRNDPAFEAKLRGYPEAWAIYQKSPPSLADMTADSFIEYALLEERPKLRDFNRLLHTRFKTLADDPAFQARVRRNARAWEVFEEIRLDSSDLTLDQTIAYLLKHGTEPQQSVDTALYQRYFRLKKDPSFLAGIEDHPEAWRILLFAKMNSTEKAATRVLAHIRSQGAIPLVGQSEFKEIYDLFIKNHSHPDFHKILSEDAEAWKLYLKWVETHARAGRRMLADSGELKAVVRKQDPSVQLALQKAKSVLQDFGIDGTLDRDVIRLWKDQPGFLRELKLHPKAWQAYLEFNFGSPREVALRSIDFFLKHDFLPLRSLDERLADAFYRVCRDPDFSDEISKHPGAWTLYQGWLKAHF